MECGQLAGATESAAGGAGVMHQKELRWSMNFTCVRAVDSGATISLPGVVEARDSNSALCVRSSLRMNGR